MSTNNNKNDESVREAKQHEALHLLHLIDSFNECIKPTSFFGNWNKTSCVGIWNKIKTETIKQTIKHAYSENQIKLDTARVDYEFYYGKPFILD